MENIFLSEKEKEGLSIVTCPTESFYILVKKGGQQRIFIFFTPIEKDIFMMNYHGKELKGKRLKCTEVDRGFVEIFFKRRLFPPGSFWNFTAVPTLVYIEKTREVLVAEFHMENFY